VEGVREGGGAEHCGRELGEGVVDVFEGGLAGRRPETGAGGMGFGRRWMRVMGICMPGVRILLRG
jgi:hypothetical protein